MQTTENLTDEDRAHSPAPARPSRRKRRMFVLLALLLLCAGVVSVVVLKVRSNAPHLPPSIAAQLHFPVYLPHKLPGNYKINMDSFAVNEGVLIFEANDGAGGSIAFTEQAKPTNLNFDDFYRQQFPEAKTLSGVPYPTVIGKTKGAQSLPLSIVTDRTWIITNTQSPLGEDDMRLIAQNIKRY